MAPRNIKPLIEVNAEPPRDQRLDKYHTAMQAGRVDMIRGRTSHEVTYWQIMEAPRATLAPRVETYVMAYREMIYNTCNAWDDLVGDTR